MSLVLLHKARREAIIRLFVWMAIGLLVYVLYGRTHSEVNNPRLDTMPVMHENFSAENLNNYQGYTDDDLRQQYARQMARRMGYRRNRYSGYTVDGPASAAATAAAVTVENGGERLDDERASQIQGSLHFDGTTLSHSGIDSGHGVKREGSVSICVLSDVTSMSESKEASSSPTNSPGSFQPLRPRLEPYPEPAHLSSRVT